MGRMTFNYEVAKRKHREMGQRGQKSRQAFRIYHRRNVEEDVQESRVPFLRISDFGKPWDLPCRSPFTQ